MLRLLSSIFRGLWSLKAYYTRTRFAFLACHLNLATRTDENLARSHRHVWDLFCRLLSTFSGTQHLRWFWSENWKKLDYVIPTSASRRLPFSLPFWWTTWSADRIPSADLGLLRSLRVFAFAVTFANLWLTCRLCIYRCQFTEAPTTTHHWLTTNE